MKKRSFYGKGIPHIDPSDLTGCLVVIEGADGSGRSTQGQLLRDWLGRLGYPSTEVGLKRSTLVGPELEEAMQGNTLGPRTLSLFYATDFADQLEHIIIPSLRAGFVVLADRYIYTLMARDLVRGADPKWIQSVYGIALVPDLIFYLKVPPLQLADRSFTKDGFLDYWESGMDIERSGDMHQCFVRYQGRLQREFDKLSKQYGFKEVDGTRAPHLVHAEMQKILEPLLARRKIQSQMTMQQGAVQQSLPLKAPLASPILELGKRRPRKNARVNSRRAGERSKRVGGLKRRSRKR
jgi:dTMP kinase